MSENLKPCPFCGGTAKILPAEVYGYGDVYCENCGAQVMGFNTREALDKWERRAETETETETSVEFVEQYTVEIDYCPEDEDGEAD